MAAPHRISIGVNVDASGAKAGSGVARQAVALIGAEADKAAPKIERAAESIRKLESAGGTGAAAASIDAVRAAAAAAAPSMERLVNAFAGITAPAANDNGRAADIAAYGAELDRLRAKLDPVFAAQQAYRQKLDEINHAERVGAITASAAIDIRIREAAAYEALINKVERLGAARKAAAQQIVDRQTITPDRGADVEAYGRSLDQLRARYNPLYAAIIQYKQAQLEIRNAHAVGAISADEMTAALSRQRQMTLASIDAIKGRNRALADTPPAAVLGLGAQRFQSANLAFQAQDIAVTAAMGMNPLMIGLQQGTQIASVLATMEKPVSGLALAFASLVNPVSLVTVGLTAGTAALIQYFTTAEDGAEKTNALLEQQNDVIRRAAAFWGEATPALKAYVDELNRAQGFSDGREAFEIVAQREFDGLREKLLTVKQEFIEAQRAMQGIGADPAFLRDFREAFAGLGEELENGTASVGDFNDAQQAVASAVATYGVPQVLAFERAFDRVSSAIVRAIENARKARVEWISAIAGGTNVQDILSRSTFVDDGETLQTDQFVPRNPAVPGRRPLIELEGLPGADKIARGATGARNAYRDLIKSADDRIEQMKLEAEMAGKVGIEAEALRFELDLLQRAEDKGRSVTQAQRAAIASRVEAFKDYAEAAATAKLQADLLWESEQTGRTWMEQQVAGRLRSAGLDVDFDSYEAGIIRTQIALQAARDYAGDFVETLFDGLDQGKSLWDSFADAGIAALKRLGRSLLEDVLNNLFKVQSAAGGGSGGGLFGAIFGSLFSPQYRIAAGGGVGLYDRGGYTGPGGRHEPRGVVHAGEVVWSQADVARAGGVATVEAMRLGLAGYARGGTVGVQPMLPAGRALDQAAAPGAAGGVSRLKIELGLASDGGLDIRPQVEGVVQELAPGIAIDVVEQNNRGEADRIAAYNRNPRWR